MKTLYTLTAFSALCFLGACGNPTGETKAPTNQAEAQKAYDTAKESLAKFSSCPTENVLTDISTYTTTLGDTALSQEEWLAANGKRKGVITTASGLQYSVNKASSMTSANPPKPTQTVRVNYHGLFINGDTFDSSYDREKDIEFPLNGVIKGWTEGVGLMRPCDAWTFYIPSDLAYGPNGRGSIPPATPLVFHVQLLEITD
ncbi:MAG: FKBP-type peptidyl-prolyl cis-trans isomerase [Robiginitomaculum sp.]|nr:FKBP-type peptidyl-prolyl cis-trans isomerase [Robiginitomaculum sp.]